MNVLVPLIGVIPMQLATTIKGVTPAIATLDTQAVGFLAQVGGAIPKSVMLDMHACLSKIEVKLPPQVS